MTTTVDLLDALCAHLADFELPTISSVHAAASISAPQVTVQLAGHQPPQIARALLAWADTLTGVTTEAWRVPHGDSVHLSVTGRLPGGACIRVYGGMPFTKRGLGTDLAPDATTTIPLAALRHLTTLGEAHAR
jgi:hypothetical protein